MFIVTCFDALQAQQGVTKDCRLTLLTKSALVDESKCESKIREKYIKKILRIVLDYRIDVCNRYRIKKKSYMCHPGIEFLTPVATCSVRTHKQLFSSLKTFFAI
jgi:RNase P subunit RPR2